MPMSSTPLPIPSADRLVFAERSRLGLQFTERMSGYFSKQCPGFQDDLTNACQQAAERGRADGARIECTLTVMSDDLERMLMEPDHAAGLVGTVTINALGLPQRSMTIGDGRFCLFQVDTERVETRFMWYGMRFAEKAEAAYYLLGFKKVSNAPPWQAWSGLSTCFFTLFDEKTDDFYHGVLTLQIGDFLRQLGTIRVRHAQRLVERIDGTIGFLGFFARRIIASYGNVFAPSVIATPDPPVARVRPVGAQIDKPIKVVTSDGVPIRLTSYNRGRGRKPVMLVPGFTTTASSFATPTVRTNLVEYLCQRGNFNVWLLDYRASPAYAPAWSSFTLDDIAKRDYPAAVARVLEETGARKIQIVAHCVGSISLMMALLAEYLDKGELESVICSQVAADVLTADATRFKSGLYLTALMRLFGVRQITAAFNPRSWGNWLLDHILKLYPTEERCNNPVCRRLLFIFHEIYRHDQLNSATHDALRQWFGICSMQALQHLTRMVREGHVVDPEGRDVYVTLPNVKRLKGLPISFMHGGRNHAFHLASTGETLRRLLRTNEGWTGGLPADEENFNEPLRLGFSHYSRRVFDQYGHMDCFVGRQAAEGDQVSGIYAWILERLRNPPSYSNRNARG